MLKQHNSIKEIARSVRTIKRMAKPLASDIIRSLAANMDDIVIRKGAKTTITKTKPKITRAVSRDLTKKSKDLHRLMDHHAEIKNILNTLQNEFEDGDYPEKDKLIKTTQRVASNIKDKLDTLKGSLSADAKDTMPDILGQVANSLKKSLDAEMTNICKTKKIETLTALVKELPQHTMYFIYTDVEDDKNEITPKIVFALSYYDNKLYINPSLHDTVIPGKFNLGFELNGKASDCAKAALKEINQQLLADSMLSAVTGHPVPFSKNKLNNMKLKNDNVKMSFSPTGDSLLVSISEKMTDIKVQELADKITVQLNSIILADKDLPKMQIRYTKRKKPAPRFGWELIYKFIPAGKYTGKTLNQQDVDHLRQRFSDDEIRSILLVLQK